MNQDFAGPFGGYSQAVVPEEDRVLTHVGPRTPGGEYLRRFWQPVAVASELKDLPLPVRILGEDLVLLRARNGKVGLLHRHCPHRGASLEYGIVDECGLRCCYHGWLIGIDGQILETPAEPAATRLRERTYHGAYPTAEYAGLVFAYMGPPGTLPPLPLFDTFEIATQRLLPFSFVTPCNWIQIGDNGVDPVHTSFLHMIGFAQFGSDWAELPVLDFRETDIGMIYVVVLRVGDNIRVRSNDAVLPNISQTAASGVVGDKENIFSRASMTRWKVPIDNGATLQIGWRHLDTADPYGKADESRIGKDMIDIIGQTSEGRDYETRQRLPSDYDVLVSQRPIAVHARENLASSDRGVAMLRKITRRGIDAVQAGIPPRHTNGQISTFAHDTVVRIPCQPGTDDRALQQQIGRRVTDIVAESAALDRDKRRTYVAEQVAKLRAQFAAPA